jgi:hypothetical protein
MSASNYQVVLFLHLMKSCASKQFRLVSRKTNLDTLALLGMTVAEAKSRVLGLLPEDYVSGPSADQKRAGVEAWVFGLEVGSKEIYVKLYVILEPEECVCISFHVATEPLEYPFRRQPS